MIYCIEALRSIVYNTEESYNTCSNFLKSINITVEQACLQQNKDNDV